MADDIWDATAVSVKVGNFEIPDIMEVEPVYGVTINEATTPQGFAGHEVVYGASTIRVKFKVTGQTDVIAGLNAYMAAKTPVTVTYINPVETTTFTNARLKGYPTRTNADISGSPEYEITLSGRCKGPMPRA